MQVQTTTKPVPRPRSEENKRFANDASYQSVERMLQKLAFNCHKRVTAMGLMEISYEDVMQEMNLTYLMAKERWQPERGIYFSTYLTTACYRNFGAWIRKRELERRNLGMVNFSSMQKFTDDGDAVNFEELASNSGNLFGEKYAPSELNPEESLQATQELAKHRENVMSVIPYLTDAARAVVMEILTSEKHRAAGEPLVKISQVLKEFGSNKNEAMRVRKELSIVFGAKL